MCQSTVKGTFVSTRVLKEHDLALLKVQPCLLSEEKVCALDDELEVWLAIRVDESRRIGDVDGLGASSPASAVVLGKQSYRRLTVHRTAQGDRP